MNALKIAVINSMDSERTILAMALSCASGYPFIQNRTMYEWKKLYQIKENQLYSFNNQSLILSASLVERIKSEFDFTDFISNGAAFTEVLSLKLKMDEKSVKPYKPVEIAMIDNLLNITGKYAANHYDLILHVCNAGAKSFDELHAGFFEKYHIAYKLYEGGNDPQDILKNIMQEVGMPIKLPAGIAMYKAVKLVTFKH